MQSASRSIYVQFICYIWVTCWQRVRDKNRAEEIELDLEFTRITHSSIATWHHFIYLLCDHELSCRKLKANLIWILFLCPDNTEKPIIEMCILHSFFCHCGFYLVCIRSHRIQPTHSFFFQPTHSSFSVEFHYRNPILDAEKILIWENTI